MRTHQKVASVMPLLLVFLGGSLLFGQKDLPRLSFPDPEIAKIFSQNWVLTLQPCKENLVPNDLDSPYSEPLRPWKVDVNGNYPGWYPGVDLKHMAAAYLACGGDLPLVLQAWDLTSKHYSLPDGSIQSSTMKNNPQGTWPEATANAKVVFYPLRTVATIDFLLLGDMIFRFSQDREWLVMNLPKMRKAAHFLRGWIDPNGVLHSDSYDLDQAYRQHDGVAQASALLAFRRLAELESIAGNPVEQGRAQDTASLLLDGVQQYWNEEWGYFAEHLVYNNVASSPPNQDKLTGNTTVTASSQLDEEHGVSKATDGIIGMGVDAFGVGTGSAGKHEWASNGETESAWMQIDFTQTTSISGAILVNRTDFTLHPGERFESGTLEFSDGSEPVPVIFNDLGISRAVAMFSPRSVSWIRFRAKSMQSVGGKNAGLAEFVVLDGVKPYSQIRHGMTDTNLAIVGFGATDGTKTQRVWNYFQSHESKFYEVNGLKAPTWISESEETYLPEELNRRAPYKDCVAMGRTWRYDALMRKRMQDGQGLYRTMQYAHQMAARPSGGGTGFFAERYGLGKFQPGDESQANVPKYSEYPAVYASTIVQECLLGMTIDPKGVIHIDPCVPQEWYSLGFGQSGICIAQSRKIEFDYNNAGVTGNLSGASGIQDVCIQVPPFLRGKNIKVLVDAVAIESTILENQCCFSVPINDSKPTRFHLGSAVD